MSIYLPKVTPSKGRFLALVARITADGTEQIVKQMRTSYATRQAAELAASNAAVAYGSPARELTRAADAKMRLSIETAVINTNR